MENNNSEINNTNCFGFVYGEIFGGKWGELIPNKENFWEDFRKLGEMNDLPRLLKTNRGPLVIVWVDPSDNDPHHIAIVKELNRVLEVSEIGGKLEEKTFEEADRNYKASGYVPIIAKPFN